MYHPITAIVSPVRPGRRTRLATLAALLLAGACGDGGPTGPDFGDPATGQQFVGTYRLESINGNPLSQPYVQHWLGQDTYGKQYVTDGTLEFQADGSYRLFLNKALRIGSGPLVFGPEELTGSWQFEPAQAGDVSGPVRLNHPEGWDPLESTCRHASLSIL